MHFVAPLLREHSTTAAKRAAARPTAEKLARLNFDHGFKVNSRERRTPTGRRSPPAERFALFARTLTIVRSERDEHASLCQQIRCGLIVALRGGFRSFSSFEGGFRAIKFFVISSVRGDGRAYLHRRRVQRSEHDRRRWR
jgi:hypothetical protein